MSTRSSIDRSSAVKNSRRLEDICVLLCRGKGLMATLKQWRPDKWPSTGHLALYPQAAQQNSELSHICRSDPARDSRHKENRSDEARRAFRDRDIEMTARDFIPQTRHHRTSSTYEVSRPHKADRSRRTRFAHPVGFGRVLRRGVLTDVGREKTAKWQVHRPSQSQTSHLPQAISVSPTDVDWPWPTKSPYGLPMVRLRRRRAERTPPSPLCTRAVITARSADTLGAVPGR